ncbi:MAG: DUF362 domain-containing protein [Candidatus Brocadiia bacterium]
MAHVHAARCLTYEPDHLRSAVCECLQALGLADKLLRPGHTVLLKPNLLSPWDPPEKAVNTHPEFVAAVAGLCAERGCRVLIGDSCGSLGAGSTRRAMEVTGLLEVAERTGAELVDFDRAPALTVECPDPMVLKEPFHVTSAYAGADVVVTLPKLKTHGLTLLTGAVKNQFGMIPGRGKKDVHLRAPKPDTMAQALVDVYSTVKPHLAIMDAVMGMEGAGPAAGSPRRVGLVLASDDGVALDAVEAAVMGIEEGRVLTTQYAHRRAVGCGRLADVGVSGLPVSEAAVEGFKKPAYRTQNALMRIVPEFAVRWLFSQFGSTFPQVEHGACILCGECVRNCPASALSRLNGRIEVARQRCIGCYCCTEVCRERAIQMRRPLLGRVFGNSGRP